MEKGKYKVDTEKKTVTFGHETKTLDGKATFTTTFDFSKVDLSRLLYDAGTARLIKWRASTGIKGLSTEEAIRTLSDATVDCSLTVTRAKHVETEEEKELRAMMKEAMAKGGDLKSILARVREAMASGDKEAEEAELEAGETTE